MASDSYAKTERCIINHEKFNHRTKNPSFGHYSVLEDGHYKVFTKVVGGKILLLDMIGDRVVHVDKTYYPSGSGLTEGDNPIRTIQKIIAKYYH